MSSKFGINIIFGGRNYLNEETIDLNEFKARMEAGQQVTMVMPLSLQQADGSFWTFPFEPIISISGGNVVVKRNVAKSSGRGTIKERWAEDDYSIQIQGFFRHTDWDTYPKEDVETFRNIVTQRREIEVQNELFAALNINRIVVEMYSLPFTKGKNCQNFTIDAVSDDVYDLFIEVKNV